MKNNNVSVIKGSECGKNANTKGDVDMAHIAAYNNNMQKMENMRLIAGDKENGIYDAGDNWYHSWHNASEKKDEEIYIPKTEQLHYPLAACLKWGFKPVDVGYLNALSKGGLKGVEEYLKTHP